MQQLIRAGLTKTLEEYRNLTSTTEATATQQFDEKTIAIMEVLKKNGR